MPLTKTLANERHFPSVSWLDSYSGYAEALDEWYRDNVDGEAMELRAKMLGLLHEESRLQDIVQLVGEDVLPDQQRLILEISRIIRTGFLQQNAFHDEDAFVPMKKQYGMLKLMEVLYEKPYRP